MKILVFPHHLEIGGSQINAIDLATAMRDRYKHEVVFFATPGPALALIEQRGFRCILAPTPRIHPSPSMGRALRRAVAAEQPELIHIWDWPQAVDAHFAIGLLPIPLVCSEMSMSVPETVPRHITLTLGTEQLVDAARRRRSGPTALLEPPVDTALNCSSAVDPSIFRSRVGLEPATLTIVIVSRLVKWLKQEGIERTISATSKLAQDCDVRLVIVGSGPIEARLRSHARHVNQGLGRQVVLLTGEFVDPRQAYAAADIVVAMGGSALRAMAFAKPVIVVGEHGFSEIFSPATSEHFFRQGYYGRGVGDRTSERLEAQLASLLRDPQYRTALGCYSAAVVSARYGIDQSADRVEKLYRVAQALPRQRQAALKETIRIGVRRGLSGLGVSRLRQRRRARP